MPCQGYAHANAIDVGHIGRQACDDAAAPWPRPRISPPTVAKSDDVETPMTRNTGAMAANAPVRHPAFVNCGSKRGGHRSLFAWGAAARQMAAPRQTTSAVPGLRNPRDDFCREHGMRTLARSAYLDSKLGVDSELQGAGSALEHPIVYDSAAREIKELASQGFVEIIEEHQREIGGDVLIDRLRYRRMR